MSQQTQVPRAAAYFAKWIHRWPDVQALARASIDEVNEVWAGLGYYRRARFLLDGAKYITEQCGGLFPTTNVALQAIPGVGAYTSAAIASIACGQQVAVVDANVMRILARLHCLDWDLKQVKKYTPLAEHLVDPVRPGDFNQAVMELGASICTIHQTPACHNCPINGHCRAYQKVKEFPAGEVDDSIPPLVTDYPVKAEKPKRREEIAAVCVVEVKQTDTAESYVLLVKRPPDGLLAGLWEMPLQLVSRDDTNEANQRTMNGYLEESLGLDLKQSKIVSRKSLGSIVHVFSHIRLTLNVEMLCLTGDVQSLMQNGLSGRPEVKWLEKSKIASEGLSSSVRKVMSMVSVESCKERKSIKRFFGQKQT